MRTDFEFDSQGTKCEAWLYRPESDGPGPCVVMAHGFSAVRDQRLDVYAEHFEQAGIAVLLFDYRHFGTSAGEPRQLLSIRRQLQDWQAAIAAVRTQSGIDPTRIALFGSSFSGGHVQALAARDSAVAAVIAQAPFCDGLRNLSSLGLGHVLRLTMAGLRDVLMMILGRQPYYIEAVGAHGDLAVMVTPDAAPGFANMTPPGSSWRNMVAARIALMVGAYRPGAAASKIRCPILYSIGELDIVTPARFAHDASRLAPQAEVKTYPCGHFDVYISPLWEKIIADQTEFLVRHLRPRLP